jgi:hypothetical protein
VSYDGTVTNAAVRTALKLDPLLDDSAPSKATAS